MTIQPVKPEALPATSLRDSLAGGLIVSCQPVTGGPLDLPDITARLAEAAVIGGARAVRVESEADVRATRQRVSVPLIGLIKRTVPGSNVFITPEPGNIELLLAAGADIVAFDATFQERHAAGLDIREAVQSVQRAGRLAMADISTFAEGISAAEAGADFIATTLAGYAGDRPPSATPDLELVRELAAAGVRVVAEGRISTPEQAAAALAAGAFAVTVGTAITRTELVTGWFAAALR
jgi:N-acylglucosamine-6-phosphate 2-epimerase